MATSILDMLGPRGGVTAAMRTINARGGHLTPLTIHGAIQRARERRRRNAHWRGDPLATPAWKALENADREYVTLLGYYGRWVPSGRGAIVPSLGAYGFARNPGYGGNPRCYWTLRTGGTIGDYYRAPPQRPIP